MSLSSTSESDSLDTIHVYGPWATALDTEPGARLSTFWQRRMAMLPILNRTASRLSTRARVCLAASAVAALASPLAYVSRTPAARADDTATATTASTNPTAEFFPPLTKSEEKILAELEKQTAVLQFDETPLQDVMDFFREHHGIEIQLDHKAMEDAAVGSDTPVTLHVKGTTLRSALRLLLDGLDLTFDVRNDVLQITTKDKADAMLYTRVYPVDDLVELQDYDSLADTITDIVAPQTWDEVGGPGSIDAVKRARSLVVSQTHETHEKILDLLRSLRAARETFAPHADLKKKK
jgi:hypothetical protein